MKCGLSPLRFNTDQSVTWWTSSCFIVYSKRSELIGWSFNDCTAARHLYLMNFDFGIGYSNSYNNFQYNYLADIFEFSVLMQNYWATGSFLTVITGALGLHTSLSLRSGIFYQTFNNRKFDFSPLYDTSNATCLYFVWPWIWHTLPVRFMRRCRVFARSCTPLYVRRYRRKRTMVFWVRG